MIIFLFTNNKLNRVKTRNNERTEKAMRTSKTEVIVCKYFAQKNLLKLKLITRFVCF